MTDYRCPATRMIETANEADALAAMAAQAATVLMGVRERLSAPRCADHDPAAVAFSLAEIEECIAELVEFEIRMCRHAELFRLRAAAWVRSGPTMRDVLTGTELALAAGPSGGEGPGVAPAAPHR